MSLGAASLRGQGSVARVAYGVRELAQMVGVHEMTMRRWVQTGTVPSYRLGGRRLIPASVVDSLNQPPPAKTRT